MALPDSDSGVFIRGSGTHQVNIWCWPIGSGECTACAATPAAAEIRRVTPRKADKPVANGTVTKSPCAATP